MRPVTVVLYNADDVTRFYADEPAGVEAILPLTPVAQALLQEASRTVLDPLKAHSAFGHARDVIRCARLERFLQARLKHERGFSRSGRHALIENSLLACGVASRLWTTLGVGGGWLLPTVDGWHRAEDRREAHRLLLKRFFEPYNQAPIIESYGQTDWLTRWKLRYYNLKFLKACAPTRPIAMNAFTRGFAELCQALHAEDPTVWQVAFNPLNANAQSLASIKTWLKMQRDDTLQPRQITLTVPPARMPRLARKAHALLDAVTDPVARAGVDALRPYIVTNVEWVESIRPQYARYLKMAKARSVLVWDVADRLNAALADGGQQAGVPVGIICHTSASAGLDRVSREAKRRRNQSLCASDLGDLLLAQSPYAEAAIQQTDPRLPIRRIQPVVWGLPAKQVPLQSAGKEFIILHAGNYFEWSAYLPWAYETSLDFVHGLRALIQAAGQLPDTRVIVRMKSNFERKAEFGPGTLQRLLPPGEHWEIRDSGSFYEDMAQADLVVSFHSTTIEEALMARRPVLLWGGGQRYHHVPAATAFPQPEARDAVYTVKTAAELPDMLRAIQRSHAGRPLTDVELEGRVWPLEVPDAQVLAQRLLMGLDRFPPDAPLSLRAHPSNPRSDCSIIQ